MTDETASTRAEQRLFLQFPADSGWTEEEIEEMTKSVSDALPDSVGVTTLPDSIEYMDQEEIEEYVQELVEALE